MPCPKLFFKGCVLMFTHYKWNLLLLIFYTESNALQVSGVMTMKYI
jgi:hypothetical protein